MRFEKRCPKLHRYATPLRYQVLGQLSPDPSVLSIRAHPLTTSGPYMISRIPFHVAFTAVLLLLGAASAYANMQKDGSSTTHLPYNVTKNVAARLFPLREAIYSKELDYPQNFSLHCLRDDEQGKVAVPLRVHHVSPKSSADPTSVQLYLPIREDRYFKLHAERIKNTIFVFQVRRISFSGYYGSAFNKAQPTFVHIGDGNCVYLGDFSDRIDYVTAPINCVILSENYETITVEYCEEFFNIRASDKILLLQTLFRNSAGRAMYAYKAIKIYKQYDGQNNSVFRYLDLICTEDVCDSHALRDAIYASEKNEYTPNYPDIEDY